MASYDMMRSYLELIVAGRFDDAMEYFTDDITLHFAGWKSFHGKDEYREAVGHLMAALGSMEVKEHDLLISDDHAVVLNSWHITTDDLDRWVNNAVIYHTVGDKITEAWIVSEDQELLGQVLG